MQQSYIFVFILLVSFFLISLTTLMILVIVSEIKMENMFDQIIKETKNEIEYNKIVVDINKLGNQI